MLLYGSFITMEFNFMGPILVTQPHDVSKRTGTDPFFSLPNDRENSGLSM